MTSPKNIKRLETRLEELTLMVNNETNEKNESISNLRKANRTIRELQYQLEEHDKSKSRFEQEICKCEQKVGKMREVIEEMVSLLIIFYLRDWIDFLGAFDNLFEIFCN